MTTETSQRADVRRRILYSLVMLAGAFIWGSAFVSQSVGAEYVGPFTFLAFRSYIAVAFLFPLALGLDTLRKRGKLAGDGAGKLPFPWKAGAACGAILFAASAFQQAGMAYTTTAKAGFLTALYVVIVPFVSIFFGYRVRRVLFFCVALTLAGLYLLCFSGSVAFSKGDLLMIVCAFLFAAQIMTLDRLAPGKDGVKLSAVQFTMVALLATLFMLIFERPTGEALAAAFPSILYAGLFSSGLAYTFQIIAQKNLPPALCSLLMCGESVFSALTGFVVLHEVLSVREVCGCVLMFVSTIIAVLL